MQKILYISLMAIVTCVNVKAQGIKFETGSWSDVKSKARIAGKPVFIDAYTTWCKPCKVMAATVFTNDTVAGYFNETFINYQMDMEKGDGIAFAREYEVNAFPTLLYFDSKGNLSFRAVGAKDAKGLISQAKLSFDPAHQLATFKKEYEEGSKTLNQLYIYLGKLKEAGSYNLASEVIANHFAIMKDKEKITKEAWKVITEYVYDYENSIFEFVVKNRASYNKLATAASVNKYIFDVLARPRIVIRGRGRGDISHESLHKYITRLQGYKNYVEVDYFIARMQYLAYLSHQDSSYLFAKNFFDKKYAVIYNDDKFPYFLSYMSNQYINEEGEKAASALQWAGRAVKLAPDDYKPAYVLAQLLYNKGDFEGALRYADKAAAGYARSSEAPVIKQLFKAETIDSFILKIKAKMKP